MTTFLIFFFRSFGTSSVTTRVPILNVYGAITQPLKVYGQTARPETVTGAITQPLEFEGNI
jgi:hypothetical protein